MIKKCYHKHCRTHYKILKWKEKYQSEMITVSILIVPFGLINTQFLKIIDENLLVVDSWGRDLQLPRIQAIV